MLLNYKRTIIQVFGMIFLASSVVLATSLRELIIQDYYRQQNGFYVTEKGARKLSTKYRFPFATSAQELCYGNIKKVFFSDLKDDGIDYCYFAAFNKLTLSMVNNTNDHALEYYQYLGKNITDGEVENPETFCSNGLMQSYHAYQSFLESIFGDSVNDIIKIAYYTTNAFANESFSIEENNAIKTYIEYIFLKIGVNSGVLDPSEYCHKHY